MCVEVSFGEICQRPAALFRLQHKFVPVNIAKFLIKRVLKNICIQLLLKIIMKKISWKATSHNDHCILNMGVQRPKIGGN